MMRILTIIAAATSCIAASAAAAEDRAAETEIGALRGAFVEAVARGDFAALGALLAEGAVLVQPGTAEWEAMRAAAGGAPYPPGAAMEIRPLEVKVIDDQWAFEFGTTRIAYADPASGERREVRDTYLIVLRNDGDGWGPYREVASASPPPGGWPDGPEPDAPETDAESQ